MRIKHSLMHKIGTPREPFSGPIFRSVARWDFLDGCACWRVADYGISRDLNAKA